MLKKILVLCLLSGPSLLPSFLASFLPSVPNFPVLGGEIGNKIERPNKDAVPNLSVIRNYHLLLFSHTLARCYCPDSAPTELNPLLFRVRKAKRLGEEWLRHHLLTLEAAVSGRLLKERD